jgi:hypothetical protein
MLKYARRDRGIIRKSKDKRLAGAAFQFIPRNGREIGRKKKICFGHLVQEPAQVALSVVKLKEEEKYVKRFASADTD